MADVKAEWPMRAAAHSNGRSALLIRCSDREATLIRSAAKHEHRTLSGYVQRCDEADGASQPRRGGAL
jgi:uncharacterized protein (DUF1778 family)